eukprot:1341800-Amorphochlora_amoeboformis.AAC.1
MEDSEDTHPWRAVHAITPEDTKSRESARALVVCLSAENNIHTTSRRVQSNHDPSNDDPSNQDPLNCDLSNLESSNHLPSNHNTFYNQRPNHKASNHEASYHEPSEDKPSSHDPLASSNHEHSTSTSYHDPSNHKHSNHEPSSKLKEGTNSCGATTPKLYVEHQVSGTFNNDVRFQRIPAFKMSQIK